MTKKLQEKRKNAKGKKNNKRRKTRFLSEIMALVSLFVFIILLLSLFGIGSHFGENLKDIQKGIFGYLAYPFPFVFIISYFLLAIHSKDKKIKIKVFLFNLIFISFLGILNLFSPYHDFENINFLEIYKDAKYAGVLGVLISSYLSFYVGKVVSFILFIIIIISSILFLGDFSFISFVDFLSSRFSEKVSDYKEYRRSLKEEREEDFEDDLTDNTNRNGYKKKFISQIDKVIKDKSYKNLALKEYEKDFVKDDLEEPIEDFKDKLSENEIKKIISNEEKDEDDFSITEENKDITNLSDIILKPKQDINLSKDENMDLDILKRVDNLLKKRDEEIKNSSSIIVESDYEEEEEVEDFSYKREEERISSNEYEKDRSEKITLNNSYNGEFTKKEFEKTEENKIEKVEDKDLDKPANQEFTNIKSSLNKEDNSFNDLKEEKKNLNKDYVFPPSTLLKNAKKVIIEDEEYRKVAIKLQQTLQNFGVEVKISNISKGPVVTRYELIPKQGVKVSKIVSLQDDIKLSLAAEEIRIEAPIPGKSAIGIEVPNKENNIVSFRELVENIEFKENKNRISFAIGRDISGKTVISDIAKMPHLLIAGATGSGKSVCINTLIMSILYAYSPEDVKLIMIDPKVVELSVYNGIPHLLIPVVTEAKKAASAINWAVAEMTERYKKFAEASVRDIVGYNEKIKKEKMLNVLDHDVKKMPQIVIIIDELSDLMMLAQNEVEEAICRLAQLARACGIHLVIATQRPSVNVITGLIKANIPSRIAFAVSSSIDSRTIIDSGGAEKLLGKGDMLFSPQGTPKPIRVQGALVSDEEVFAVVDFIKNQGLEAQYDNDTIKKIESNITTNQKKEDEEYDDLFLEAGRLIIEKDKASIGNLQRIFKIGFNRAARIMDQLYEAGVVGSEQGTKPREILMDLETFNDIFG